MHCSHFSNSSAGRAFSEGKLPTTPALHWAITSSGTETMNIGAPTTGRASRSLKILGRATLSPSERNAGSLSGGDFSRNSGLGWLNWLRFSAPCHDLLVLGVGAG